MLVTSKIKIRIIKQYCNELGAITLPLRESRLSQLVGDAERGAVKNLINSNTQLNPNNFTPSQNFLAENFTLPQGEGDEPVSVARFTKKVPVSFL